MTTDNLTQQIQASDDSPELGLQGWLEECIPTNQQLFF